MLIKVDNINDFISFAYDIVNNPDINLKQLFPEVPFEHCSLRSPIRVLFSDNSIDDTNIKFTFILCSNFYEVIYTGTTNKINYKKEFDYFIESYLNNNSTFIINRCDFLEFDEIKNQLIAKGFEFYKI